MKRLSTTAIVVALLAVGCSSDSGDQNVSVSLAPTGGGSEQTSAPDEPETEPEPTTEPDGGETGEGSDEPDPEQFSEADPADEEYAATPDGLADYLSDVFVAFSSADVSAMHRLQADHCGHTEAEVAVAWVEIEVLFRSFFNIEFVDYVAEFKFVVIGFDESTLTGTVEAVLSVDAPVEIRNLVLASEEEPPAVYEYRDGRWHGVNPDDCPGAPIN